MLWRRQAPSLRRVSRRSKGRLAVVPKNGAAAAQAARSVARDPRLPSWMQPSRLPGPPGPRIALCAAAFGLLLPGRGFFSSVAGLLAAEQTIPRARLLPRASMAVLACSCSTVTAVCAPAWCRCPHFFLNCQNRLSEQANLDSKLKVEVCVRTGTKFVSEQGLGTPQRESVALALGRTCCVLSPSVARRETSRQEEGRSGATGNVRAPEL